MTPFNSPREDLQTYCKELNDELKNILQYWMDHTLDLTNGGFVGRITNSNKIEANAAKGSVLNARILWSFAAGYNLTGNPVYLPIADRAFEYMSTYFVDHEFGGVYWLLDAKGNPLDPKKQVYAIAFAIYAFSEYHSATQNPKAKVLAVKLYNDLIKHTFDNIKGGYFEAFSREWQPIADLRLSDKDANEQKTMNTHLHVLEAFTNLYRIWPDETLKLEISSLIGNFTQHIIDQRTGHLILFFNESWEAKSATISYGHDIEAAWLLLEAAETINDETLIAQLKGLGVQMAKASKEGLDTDGGLAYEFETNQNHLVKEKHWWVQAEAMIGFYNAWEISNNEDFLKLSLTTWEFVKANIIDHQKGEWFWGVDENGKPTDEDKVGVWKCPYHNSRACMELIRRMSVRR